MMSKLLADDSTDENNNFEHKKASCLSPFITAVSNFSVQYNFNSISIALIIMSESQCTSSLSSCKEGDQSSWVTGTVTAMVFLGAITGQLAMGYAGDVLGRNKAMTLTLSLVCISALLSAILPFGSPSTVYTVIIITRFVMGIGLGGIYPLSATKAAEDGGDAHGHVNVTSASYAFFWQTPGAMTPWFIAYLFTFFDGFDVSMRWRLLLGLGAIPSGIVVVCSVIEARLQEIEQERISQFTRLDFHGYSGKDDRVDEEELAEQKGTDPTSSADVFSTLLSEPDLWRKMMSTGGCWFIYDIAYYGVNLFGGEILKALSDRDDDSVSSNRSVRTVTQQQLIALGTGLPAILLGIYCIERAGLKNLQMVGFLFIALCFVLLAALFQPLQERNQDALFSVYCFLLFSLSFGPNLTTFVLPARTFSKKSRATFNGLSAAMGKVGAFTGVYIFGPVAEASSYPTVMALCAGISAVGALMSFWYIDEGPYTNINSGEYENSPLHQSDDSNVKKHRSFQSFH